MSMCCLVEEEVKNDKTPPTSQPGSCYFVGELAPRGRCTQQLKLNEMWSGSFTSCPEPWVLKDKLSSWRVLASVSSSRSGGSNFPSEMLSSSTFLRAFTLFYSPFQLDLSI